MTIDEQIESAYYAKGKQLNSLVLESNQGEIELLEDEYQEIVKFIDELMTKRIERAEKLKKKWHNDKY